jgi:hypothetical protein
MLGQDIRQSKHEKFENIREIPELKSVKDVVSALMHRSERVKSQWTFQGTTYSRFRPAMLITNVFL